MMRAIQVVETFATAADAYQALEGQRDQFGYIGGRVIHPCAVKPGYRMQTFHDATGVVEADIAGLEGTRLVLIPDGLARQISDNGFQSLRGGR